MSSIKPRSLKSDKIKRTSSPGSISTSLDRVDLKLKLGDDPRLIDHSVNAARVYIDQDFSLVMESSIRTNQAGNFNGGGTGSKPMASLLGYSNISVSDLPAILAEIEHRAITERGLSFNILLDLQGQGNPADYKIMSVTNTLNGVVDKYSKTGSAASVTDFDINSFSVIPGYVSGEKAKFLKNHFYIIGGLPDSYVIGTNFRTGSIVDNSWPGIPMSLDVLLNGGTMPLTGAQFSIGYPNCKVISTVSLDGGHPRGSKLGSIIAQFGDSSNNVRAVTAVTSLKLDGVELLSRYRGL